MDERIAVTVVAGFLGAGKTTLLNRMVRRAGDSRLAVIVNDFGALNIDAALVAEVTDAVYSLQNGCICCTVQEDLLAQLASLAQLSPRLERIVIECSGVSDPQRIVQTLGYPQLRGLLRLDLVITLVDATRHLSLEGEYARLARAQVSAADVLLLNKSDLVDADELARLREVLPGRSLLHVGVQADLPDSLWLDAEPPSRVPGVLTPVAAADHGQLFESWVWEGEGVFDAGRLRAWLAGLPDALFRLKGWVRLEAAGGALWLQQVGRRSQFGPVSGPVGDGMRLVFIVRRGFAGRQALEGGLRACLR
ncbi:cobalamin synthesis protein P47K [Pseudomonas sp. Pc102]|uniref:CobW family GTP-binding protein n=1 Tax=Pseudomonas sp. Pc102 TaxID=2678261 RepID=UPI001BCEB42E|nr:GTP-binding protein [Pseudomonas sp. Pc102]BBP80644.1 cobalamin synthesis protein P47K [Pseudomonas sp. Pc102]